MNDYPPRTISSILPLIVLLLVVLGCVGGKRNQSNTGSQSNSVELPAAPPLELTSWQWSPSASGMLIEVNGEVQNVSNENLESLRVVAEFRTKDGTLITTEEGRVEYSPLLPRQSSSFKIFGGKFSPEMATCRLRFKTRYGDEIDYTNKSKSPAPTPAKSKRK